MRRAGVSWRVVCPSPCGCSRSRRVAPASGVLKVEVTACAACAAARHLLGVRHASGFGPCKVACKLREGVKSSRVSEVLRCREDSHGGDARRGIWTSRWAVAEAPSRARLGHVMEEACANTGCCGTHGSQSAEVGRRGDMVSVQPLERLRWRAFRCRLMLGVRVMVGAGARDARVDAMCAREWL